MLYDFIYKILCTTKTDTNLKTTIFTLFHALRRLLTLLFDPSVIYRLRLLQLKMPLSHDLGIILKNHPDYGFNIGRIAKVINETIPSLHIIDIGANVGDTVSILRVFVNCPILAIEGDSKYSKFLTENIKLYTQVEIEKSYVGNSQNRDYRAIQSGGSAYLIKSTINANVSFKTLNEIIEQHPNFKNSKFLKIDTDGFDLQILQNSSTWLKASQPIIFFEYDPAHFSRYQSHNELNIFEFLLSENYLGVLVYLKTGEYLLSLELTHQNLVKEIEIFLNNRGDLMYFDLCVFPAAESTLFKKIRDSELNYFKAKQHKNSFQNI